MFSFIHIVLSLFRVLFPRKANMYLSFHIFFGCINYSSIFRIYIHSRCIVLGSAQKPIFFPCTFSNSYNAQGLIMSDIPRNSITLISSFDTTKWFLPWKEKENLWTSLHSPVMNETGHRMECTFLFSLNYLRVITQLYSLAICDSFFILLSSYQSFP